MVHVFNSKLLKYNHGMINYPFRDFFLIQLAGLICIRPYPRDNQYLQTFLAENSHISIGAVAYESVITQINARSIIETMH